MAIEPDPIPKIIFFRRKNGGYVRISTVRIRMIARLAEVDTEVVEKFYKGHEISSEQASKIRFYSKKQRGKLALKKFSLGSKRGSGR